MASYIQGVTDYIPDFQPFQPDYNFYANVLQTKQNQYDSNYKELNNLYGQLYYQNVTRDSSNKMKEGYLKNIDFELKRVSGLDLSLEQNVDQAKQVFKPIYENKNLMKDMALTKNYTNERSRALSLATSKNKEDKGSYWDVGIKDMDYRLEEFKNAAESDVLSFGNISYTPYVNASNKYQELAKAANLSVDMNTPDKSGMYMIRQKNGDLIIPSLQKLFYSDYINDPALQKVKATEAYVKRKEEAKARAPKYNNNEILAEKEYLKEQFLFLRDFAKEKTKQSEDAVTVSNNKKNSVENSIQKGEVNPFQPAFLKRIAQAIEVDEIVYQHNKNLDDEITSNVSTYSGNTDFTNIEGLDLDNIESARQKVDFLQANYIAEQEIKTFADIYSKNGMILDYKVNPIGLANLTHSHNLNRDAINNQRADARANAKIISDSNIANAKIAADKKNAVDKFNLENGFATINSNGDVVPFTAAPQKLEIGEGGEGGNTANKDINRLKYNRKFLFETVDNLSTGYMDVWINTIKTGIENKEISPTELSYLLGQNQEWGPKMWNKFKTDYSNPEKRKELINTLTINQNIFDYKKRMDNWSAKNKGLDVANVYLSKEPMEGRKIEKMKIFYDVHLNSLKENRGRIINALSTELKTSGITNDKLRYTIINEYMDKYITGKIYEDGDFTDHLGKIFDNFEKKGVSQRPPGFFSRVGKAITKVPSIVNTSGTTDVASGLYKLFTGTTSSSIMGTLNTAYENIVKNPSHDLGLKSYLPDEESGPTGRTSLKATPVSVEVNLGHKDDNYSMFLQTLEDINKINFNQANTDTHRISTKGNILDKNYKVDIDLNNKYKNILFDLAALGKNKSQLDTPTSFKLIQSQIGAENEDSGAMKFKNIPNDIIEKYFDKDDADQKEIMNEIKTNGITYIAPKSSWNNSLFKSNTTSPTQALLNTGSRIQYIDPKYGHMMVLDKDNVTGKYRYNVIIKGINDEGKYYQKNLSDFAENIGNNIDKIESNIMNEIVENNKQLDEQFQSFHRQGFTEGVTAFNNSFGKTIKNAGYKVLD